jgi:hypothetical protein
VISEQLWLGFRLGLWEAIMGKRLLEFLSPGLRRIVPLTLQPSGQLGK